MYRSFFRKLLFLLDAETAHHFTFACVKLLLKLPFAANLLSKMYASTRKDLAVKAFGLEFSNPVGLAAGFDKDAKLGTAWKHFGFGFVEIGTITPRPQSGNPKKRLFRLPKDKAIINRMGFNNLGVEVAAERLSKMDKAGIILGANIGKNKDTPNENAVDDYVICFEKLFPYVDYFVVNVSSPNTPNLRALQEKEPLTQLLSTLVTKNKAQTKPKPILLKIAPDLTDSQLEDIIEVVKESQIQGVIATNTTINREGLQTTSSELEAIGAGGLSGKPLSSRATEVIRYLSQKSGGKLPIIGVGGIMTAEDAVEKLAAGACLVQIYTGFVYNGAGFVKDILEKIKK
ncbi:MAG: quinone-dependent dihydroorotate dehydrogenase [Bacteroidia bacterium]